MSLEPSTSSPTPESNPVVTNAPARSPSAAAEKAKTASRDALTAFKVLLTNPAGGLEPAYRSLGDARALGAGITFGVLSVLCFLLGGYLLLPSFVRQDLFEFLGFGGVLKCLLFAVMPFACSAGATIAIRKLFHAEGGYGSDTFIPGAALLPVSVAVLLSGMLGYGNYQLIVVLAIFSGCLGVLMLSAGYLRVMRLSERTATLAVPVVILITLFFTKTLATSVMSGPGGGVPTIDLGSMPRRDTPTATTSLSGTYEAKGPDGTTISLAFRKDGRVQMKMSSDGQNESENGTYEVFGNVVTINTTGGMPMTLFRDGNVLSADFGGMSMRFTKR